MNIRSLSSLNFYYPKHTLNLGIVDLPIFIHIKDITFNDDSPLEVYEENTLEYETTKVDLLDKFRTYLKYINNQDRLYSNFTQTFTEYMGFESVDELFYYLDEADLMAIKIHIDVIIQAMIEELDTRINKAFQLDLKTPKIKIEEKHPMPSDIKEFCSYNYNYMIGQLGIEFNPTPFFEENRGKAIFDWSLREIKLHSAYLTRKTKIETTENLWQIYVSQQDLKKGR